MHLVMKCQAMNVEMRRKKVFEECRLKYSKVLGKEWGEEAKRKAEAVKIRREIGTQTQPVCELNNHVIKHRPESATKKKEEISRSPRISEEKPLPTLPVPDLAHSLERYLKVLKPISTEKQYKEAEELVKTFQREVTLGPRLQQLLQGRATCTENWAYDYWLDDMYLLNQAPLPINSNPGMVFPRTKFLRPAENLRFAARLVSGILDYKVIIDARGLPIDRANIREKGQPLCMEQYYRLFSSYRQPGVKKDVLRTTETSGLESDHIIVMCHNQMFKLDVVNGMNRLTEDDICCQLKRIQKIAEENKLSDAGVGILTSLPRNQWAISREKLSKDEVNRTNLHIIETSIFILCLDKAMPDSIEERDDNSIALEMLHGHGSHLNSSNRWYDKTMQFIVGEDGACGLNYEHSCSEGIAVVQLIEHVLRYMDDLKQRKLVRMDSVSGLPYPVKMNWKISNDVIQDLDMARYRMDKSIANLHLELLKFDDFGKEFPKSQNMSPDCFIQLALQLTYYRIHGRLVSTYESASTRRYRLGRVDNIRAASDEALAWCEAMKDENKSTAERLQLLRTAMAAQTDYMVQTILGKGLDCHMLGLKRISEEIENTTPDLFKHETWKICNHFTLSTSQVNTTLDSFMCYGPVVTDGYGTSYNPQGNQITFCISSFDACDDTCSKNFKDCLTQVLYDMKELCLTGKEQTEKLVLQTIEETKKMKVKG